VANFFHRRATALPEVRPDIIVQVWVRSLVSTETNNQEVIHD